MNTIKLNIINHSNDKNNGKIVIFQKNEASNFNQNPIAWKVFDNNNSINTHPFEYSLNYQIVGSDLTGNHTSLTNAVTGQTLEMHQNSSEYHLKSIATSIAHPEQVIIKNKLEDKPIQVSCYRNGKILASKSNVLPDQNVIFEFQPKIYIGLVSEILEGEIINSAIVSQINTEINLFGIDSADIVLTGGGSGIDSTPYQFILENITKSI